MRLAVFGSAYRVLSPCSRTTPSGESFCGHVGAQRVELGTGQVHVDMEQIYPAIFEAVHRLQDVHAGNKRELLVLLGIVPDQWGKGGLVV